MLSPPTRRPRKNASNLKLTSVAKVRKLSQHTSIETGSSNESSNDVMLEANMGPYASFKDCENEAISAIDRGLQGLFSEIVLQSPSPYSFRLGVLYAAKLSWCDALRSLLLATQTSPSTPTDRSDMVNQHPLFDKYFRQDKSDFSSNLNSKTHYEELALLTSVAEGSYKAVQVLVEFINPNFRAMLGRPFLRFVYLNKNKVSRRRCLQIILPKLDLSDFNLAIAAENGDLPSVKYLVDKMKATGRFLYVSAVRKSIESGHDEIAKWIASQPGLIPWKDYSGSILLSAIKAKNLEMLTFFSQYVPELMPCDLGFVTADALWKFLKNKDQALYRKLVPDFPDGYVLYQS